LQKERQFSGKKVEEIGVKIEEFEGIGRFHSLVTGSGDVGSF